MTTPELACPLCRGTNFQREATRRPNRWRWTSRDMTLLICTRCRYVLHFYDRTGIFNLG